MIDSCCKVHEPASQLSTMLEFLRVFPSFKPVLGNRLLLTFGSLGPVLRRAIKLFSVPDSDINRQHCFQQHFSEIDTTLTRRSMSYCFVSASWPHRFAARLQAGLGSRAVPPASHKLHVCLSTRSFQILFL